MDTEPKAGFALWHFLFFAAFSEFRNKHSVTKIERVKWIRRSWLTLGESVSPIESQFWFGWLSLVCTGGNQSIWFNRSLLESFPVFHCSLVRLSQGFFLCMDCHFSNGGS